MASHTTKKQKNNHSGGIDGTMMMFMIVTLCIGFTSFFFLAKYQNQHSTI